MYTLTMYIVNLCTCLCGHFYSLFEFKQKTFELEDSDPAKSLFGMVHKVGKHEDLY